MRDRSRRYTWLFALARLRAGEEALGDIHEDLVAGGRSVFWLVRQLASTLIARSRSPIFDERRSSMLANLTGDVRYTLRTFRRRPGFALAAIVPIALGIGINTSVFSILNNVALRPLPTPGSTELVSIYQQFQGVQKRRVHGARMMFSMPEYRAVPRRGTHSVRNRRLHRALEGHARRSDASRNRRRSGHLQLLRRAEAPGRNRAGVHRPELRGRRRAGGNHPQPRAVDDHLQQRSRHRRTDVAGRRSDRRGRGRCAARFRRHGADPELVLHVDQPFSGTITSSRN